MRKKTIALVLLGAMVLTGCGSKGSKGSKGFTGEKTAEAPGGFGGTTVATVEFKDDKAVGVTIDVKNDDDTMKSDASKDGSYDMKNAPALKWHEQIDLLEEAIVKDEFDLSKISVDGDGKTDAVSGVSIAVKEYLDVVQDALDQAK